MNDSNLSELLLDINTGITYKVVEVNGINYLYNTSSVCNVLNDSVLGEDTQQHDTVVLNTNSHTFQLSSNIIGFDSKNQTEPTNSARGIVIHGACTTEPVDQVTEEVDRDLDEIISFVQEDISHDKQIIESCGKLPPVTCVADGGDNLYEQSTHLVIVSEHRDNTNSHVVSECIGLEHGDSTQVVQPVCINNEDHVTSIQNINYKLVDNEINPTTTLSLTGSLEEKDERSQLDEEEEEQEIYEKEAREEEEEEEEDEEDQEESDLMTMELDSDESFDETRIQTKIKVKLKTISGGGAQWGQCLDTVDETKVTLEMREQFMNNVEKKMMVRKKRDCTNLVEFNTSKDKLTVFICNVCNTVFDHISKYHGHMRKHTEQMVWKCRQCPIDESSSCTFRTQSLLKTHIRRVHTMLSDRKYSCELCSDRFLYASHLFQHLKTVHKSERQLKCLLCPKRFYKKSDLVAHLSIHLQLKKHLCDICGKRFSQSSNLLAHKRSHTGSRPYPCKQCGRRFRQINALNVHRTTHTPDPDDSDQIESDISLRDSGRLPRKHYCLVCGETFRYLFLLKKHMTELHESQKLFQCSECVQIYHNVYEFLSHSCISGADPNSSSSLPNLTEDSSEELISLLNEILNNTTSNSGAGGNKNEEILNILLNLAEESGTNNAELNLAEENGINAELNLAAENRTNNVELELAEENGNTEEVECSARGEIQQSSVTGEVNSMEGENMMCGQIQVDDNQMYRASSDDVDNLEMLPSGEMSAEQIFANISTCSLLPNCISSSSSSSTTNNNFSSMSFIPSARAETPGCSGKSLSVSSSLSNNVSATLYSSSSIDDDVGVVSSLMMPNNSVYPSTTFVSTSLTPVSSDPSTSFSSLPTESTFVSSSTLSATSVLSTPFSGFTSESMACSSVTTMSSSSTKYFPSLISSSTMSASSSVNYPNIIPCASDISPCSNNVILPNSTDFLPSDDADIVNLGIPNPASSSYLVLPSSTSSLNISSPSPTTPADSIFTSNILSSSNLTFDSSVHPSVLPTTTSFHCPDIDSGLRPPLSSTPTVLSCSDLKKFPIRMIVNIDNIERLKKIMDTSPQGDETLTRILVKLNKTNDMEVEKKINATAQTPDDIGDKMCSNDPPCTSPTKRKRLPLSISCDQCQATFTRWTTFRLHTSTVHNTDRKLYTCPECGKSFSYENGLKTHIRNKHERSEEVKSKFPCEVESCDLVFTSINTLNTHVKRNHDKEKRHACVVCGKSFFSKYDWKKHNRIHSGEKPFHCEHCPRQFRNSSHLFRHQRSLHGHHH